MPSSFCYPTEYITVNQPLNYYRTVADYDGVVQAVKQELTGLTTDNYIKWYYRSCVDFYFKKSVWLSVGGRFNKYSHDRTELFLRIRSLPSRLYVMRKMRNPKESLPLFFAHRAQALSKQFERGYARALDKNLYLAQRLKDLAEELRTVAVEFRAGRAGDTWLSRLEFEFNPEKRHNDSPSQAGENVARIEHFRRVLVQFEEATSEKASEGPYGIAHEPDTDTLSAANYKPDELQKGAELTLRQVALLHYYKGVTWETTTAAGEAARVAGYNSPTSGRQLKTDLNYVQRTSNRTGVEGKAIIPMCRDISAVIPHLPEDKRQQAEDELQQLELKK
ncbi:hypothetical protein [Hymenobacter convexus]|uniref:hypothetical protein n=1 Tax=Hymenobacter sp. CA1UV-4 TaxID=3063782 RepID=UPI0027132BF0|nr:hypothetical protein [Hymenobacter sp. CA1UV-4]MDO7854420.1 hypothetical protein [Hymenobacter sp. CA1UV-4]